MNIWPLQMASLAFCVACKNCRRQIHVVLARRVVCVCVYIHFSLHLGTPCSTAYLQKQVWTGNLIMHVQHQDQDQTQAQWCTALGKNCYATRFPCLYQLPTHSAWLITFILCLSIHDFIYKLTSYHWFEVNMLSFLDWKRGWDSLCMGQKGCKSSQVLLQVLDWTSSCSS